jgi:hypothetical protein
MQNFLPCGYVIHSSNAFFKLNIQGPSAEKSEACKLYPLGRQLHANFRRFYSCCMLLAAMRVQFACNWRPGYKIYATGHQSHANFAMRVQFACNWRPWYKLYATGHQSHANFACASGQLRAKPQLA